MRIVSNAIYELMTMGPRMGDREWYFPESNLYFVAYITHKIPVQRIHFSYQLYRDG